MFNKRRPILRKTNSNIRSQRNQISEMSELSEDLLEKYCSVFKKISLSPKSPPAIVDKYYLHFQVDPSVFLTACFYEKFDDATGYYVYTNIMDLYEEYYTSRSAKEKSYIISDMYDFLMSVEGISGVIHVVFNPLDTNDFLLAISEKEKYNSNIRVH